MTHVKLTSMQIDAKHNQASYAYSEIRYTKINWYPAS